MSEKFTKGKLHVVPIGGARYLADEMGVQVCDMMLDGRPNEKEVHECIANAARLALCWNNHDNLVAIIQTVRDFLNDHQDTMRSRSIVYEIESCISRIKLEGKP